MNSRALVNEDLPVLQAALDQNVLHPDQKAEDYTGLKMYSEIYEQDGKPVGIVRYSKTLRLCSAFCDSQDRVQNAEYLQQVLADAMKKAEASGFTELIFNTNAPAMAKFAIEKLGFVESQGEFVKAV